MSAPETHTFEARCKDCRRLLGQVELPRDHAHCVAVFRTKCRTSTCRERVIDIRFDHTVTADARAQGY